MNWRILLMVVFVLLAGKSIAQTPGMIYKKAVLGRPVLDPNNDGFTSASSTGFVSNDQTESEIPYKAIPVPSFEPSQDLSRGPDCSFTDFVDSGVEDPIMMYFDGTNLLFRMRMGGTAPNSKGYSLLVDTDQKFGFNGPNADPNARLGNPGFEIEISLQTNFQVAVYNVDGVTSPVKVGPNMSFNDYAQQSVALTMNCGNLDYFYDFYIPLSVLTSNFGIDQNTPLRMVAITTMNPQPAIGNNATSDVGGIDDKAYGGNLDLIFDKVVDNFFPTPISGINSGFPADRTSCPTITSTLRVASVEITGTSSEPNGTTITIYRNGIQFGTTTVSSGTWKLENVTGLVAGNIITATATASGKSMSVSNCSSIIVAASCSADITINSTNTNAKNIGGSGVAGATIKVYQNGVAVTASPASSATVDGTGTFCWKSNGNTGSCNGGSNSLSGGYKVTQTESSKCESPGVYVCIGSTTLTAAPVISTTITTSTTTVSGTSVSGAVIELYAGTTWIGSTVASGTNWSISGLSFTSGQVITARAMAGTACQSNASASVTVTSSSGGVSFAPTISGSYCTSTTITEVSGTSVEASGTTIQLFNSANTLLGSTTTTATGTWKITGLSLSSGTVIKARATASGKTQSAFSDEVTILGTSSNSGLTVNAPITEGQSPIGGTLSGAGTVRVYIDGFLLGTATVTGGTWSLAPTSPSLNVYPGGIITATITVGSNCESASSAGVVVSCTAPLTTLGITPASSNLCAGSTTTVTVNSPQTDIIYQLFNGASSSGASALGAGASINLTSAALSSTATLSIRAIKIGGVSCTSTLTATHLANVTSTITSNTLTAPATTSFCGTGDPDQITGSTPAGGNGTSYTYQWQSSSNNTTFTDIAGATAKDYNPPVISATTYYRRGVTSGFCTAYSSSVAFTIQATDLTNTITAPATVNFCLSGDPAVINGSVPTGGTGGYTYQWQSSLDNATFANIASATAQNYDPPVISNTTYYRRLVSSGSCTNFPSASLKFSVASATTSLITSSAFTLAADGTSTATITVQLKDNSGNNLTVNPCAALLNTTLGTLSAVTNNNNGTFTATLTSSASAGTALITGTLAGTAFTDNESVAFVSAGGPSPATSLISASPVSIVANGTSTSTITVQLKNASGTNINTGGATVTLSTTLGTLSAVTDNNNGTYTATLTSGTVSGNAVVTGTVGAVAITDNEIVAFTAGPASTATSLITATSSQITADGTSITTITVQLKDVNGNNLTTSGGVVVLATSLGTISAVVDNGDGTYTATLTSGTSTGAATISGTLGGASIADSEIVTFIPGMPNASTSVITANPVSIIANGTSTSLITVQLKDVNGNNITTGGATVGLTTNLGSLGAITDNNNGTYTSTLTSSTTAGNATVNGTLNASAITDNEVVAFTPGAPAVSTSIISAAPAAIIANGTSTSLVTVQLRDINNNLITTGGATITLETTAGTLGSVTDNNNGTYTATLTSPTLAGSATITGKIGAVAIGDNTSVTFIAGPASANTSLISASPATIVANGVSSSMITVQLKDVNGNLLTTGGATVTLLSSHGTLSAVTDNNDGTYTATLTSTTIAQVATITGTVNTISIVDNEQVTFVPGAPSPLTSIITASSSSITANGTSTTVITIQLKDEFGNNITTGGETVTLGTTLGSLGTVTDNNNGTYIVTLTSSTTTGSATVSGTVGGVTIADTEVVAFIPGPAAGTTSLITASPSSIVANGTSTSTITVQLKDANGNNLTTGGATIVLLTTRGTLSAVTDNNNGTYTATLTSSTTAGNAAVTGTVNATAITDNETVVFTPGPVSAATSLITASPSSIVANGTSTSTITVQLKDANGNNLTTGGATIVLLTTRGTLSAVTDNNNGTYTATLTSSTTSGNAVITGTVNTAAITDNETVVFTPGPVSAATSLITASPSSIVANGTSTSTITVQLKDANGNNLTTGGATIVLLTTRGTLSAVTDNNNGTYTATLTSSTTSGNAVITGTFNSTAITDNETVVFTPGPVSAATSLITASPSSIVANGTSTSTITVQLKDANGNNLTTGGATIVLLTTRGTLSAVTDNNNGTYTATLTSSTTAGNAVITGTLNSVSITDDETVVFTPGPASANTSIISAAPATIEANGSSTSTVTVQLRDANGNNLTTGGATITLVASAGTLGAVVDNNNGSYTAILTSATTPATATITGKVNGVDIVDNATVTFVVGAFSVANSTISAATNSITANGITTTTITIQLKDGSGNNITTGGATVQVFTTLGQLSTVTDNLDGTYTVIITSSITAGIATITASIDGSLLNDDESVAFVPGPASSTTSLITASPTSIQANGITTSVVTLTLKDANGNALTIGGATVTLSTTLGTLGAVTDNNNGTYSAVLTSSTTVGNANITATLNGVSVTDNEVVVFTPGPSSASTTLISASPATIIADGSSTSTVTVQLRDANGNLVLAGGVAVQLFTSLGTISTVTDNNNGTYTATLTSSASVGLATITGTLSSTPITDDALVNFVAGTASVSSSTITATDVNITADGVSTTTITIQLKDANGNNITTGGSVVTIETSAGTISTVSDNNDGTYTAILTSSTTAGVATLTAKISGVALTDTETVTFVPGPPSAATSTITASNASIEANGVSTSLITVQLRDAFGNLITTGGATVNLNTSLGTLSTLVDNLDGTYSATLTSGTTTGTALVTGTVNASAMTDTESVVFTPGAPSAATSIITASPGAIVANGISTALITVQLKDANGNNITTGGQSILLSTTAGVLSGVTDNNNGTYTATLTSTNTPATAVITGTLNSNAINDDATVSFVTGASSAAQSIITASSTSIIADGVSTTVITIQLRDANGNNITAGGENVIINTTAGTISSVVDNGDGTYTAILTSSTTTGIATVSATLNGTTLSDTETVTFIPGPPSAATTTITSAYQSIVADGISTTIITVQLKDANGNNININTGGYDVELFTSAGVLSGLIDNGNGTYTATLTAPASQGQATITGTLDGVTIQDTETVNFVALSYITTISASTTTLPADGSSTTTITISVKDINNNPVIGAVINVNASGGTLSTVVDNGDGTYTIILTAPSNAGTSLIIFDVNGVPSDKSIQIEFVEDKPTPTFFIPEGFSPDGDGNNDTFVIQGAEQFTVTLQVYNRWGNLVYESKAYKNDWEGLATKGVVVGTKLPDGTYYYVVDLNNGTKPFVRYMTIKRK